jgi:hypothetical protein
MSRFATSFPTDQHYAMLCRGEECLSHVLPIIDQAKACGMDCGEFLAGYEYIKDRLSRYRAAFFPDKVTPPTGAGVDAPPQ